MSRSLGSTFSLRCSNDSTFVEQCAFHMWRDINSIQTTIYRAAHVVVVTHDRGQISHDSVASIGAGYQNGWWILNWCVSRRTKILATLNTARTIFIEWRAMASWRAVRFGVVDSGSQQRFQFVSILLWVIGVCREMRLTTIRCDRFRFLQWHFSWLDDQSVE